ncbi:sigma-70 family RNA polymerase sigma factor [Rubritalea tangerina]|uniref:Sigma-70 family RNA polymerase sigma factor n=1 Tax=Rubritalea tangerina TaxID=430798 RepID=A0ABW4Z6Q7_9BACT
MSESEELDQKFISLITEHQAELTGYIRSLIPKMDGVQDVMQETNIIMWKKRHQLREISSFRAWAYKIAYFRTCTYIQKKKKGGTVFLEPDVLDQIATEYEYRSEEKIESEALTHCLAKLEAADRELITMHYEKHGGLKEYAETIKCSIGRLKHALIRIRGTLKICIEREIEA